MAVYVATMFDNEATRVQDRGMPEDELPQPVPGPELAAMRRQVGIAQQDLAKRLDVHRVTLSGWEREAEVDAIRAFRYRKTLREMTTEALEQPA